MVSWMAPSYLHHAFCLTVKAKSESIDISRLKEDGPSPQIVADQHSFQRDAGGGNRVTNFSYGLGNHISWNH